MKCQKCNTEMKHVPFGETNIGVVGVHDDCYLCPNCGFTETLPKTKPEELVKKIDKEILDRVIDKKV